MKKRIIFIFTLFVALTGFSGENRIVEQSSTDVLGSTSTKKEKPKLVVRLKSLMLHRGSTAEFATELMVFDKKCTVTWYRNAKILKEDERHKMSFDGQHIKLVIDNLEEVDRGTYKVTVKNEYGTDEGSAELAIIESSSE